MLGEQIGELRGKRTGRKMLSVDGGFKMEVTFEADGKLFGTDVMKSPPTGQRRYRMAACTERARRS